MFMESIFTRENIIVALVVITIVSLFVSNAFRIIVRWIVFLPIALLIGILCSLIGVMKDFFLSAVLNDSYFLSLLFDAIDLAIDVAPTLIAASIIAPKAKLGAIIASITCLIIEIFNIFFNKECMLFIYNGGIEETTELDFLRIAVLLGTSLLVMYIVIKGAKNGDVLGY